MDILLYVLMIFMGFLKMISLYRQIKKFGFNEL